jgi:hypothetical protein
VEIGRPDEFPEVSLFAFYSMARLTRPDQKPGSTCERMNGHGGKLSHAGGKKAAVCEPLARIAGISPASRGFFASGTITDIVFAWND